MNAQRMKFSVGLFVFCGLALAVAAVIWLGMSRFLEKGQYYVTYFNESVQGLDIDSPVKYRGVSIGRVDRIEVAPDSKLIQVVMKIESGQELDSSIVAQLKSVGITGSMFVELDRKKPGEPDRSPPLSFPSKYPVVASKPSDISLLLGGLDDVLQEIKSLKLREISDMVKATISNLNQAVSDADLKGLSRSIQDSFDSAGRLLRDERWEAILASAEEAARSLNVTLDKAAGMMDNGRDAITQVKDILAREGANLHTAFDEFNRTMKNANLFLEKGSVLLKDTDDSLYDLKASLMVTAQNLEKASENLDRLLESLSEHPSRLLFGEPPPPRELQPRKAVKKQNED
ncbi:MAG: MCE family protein [Deltaproteobacteria bacterium]|nr:MCE family protein [Deltaproteobacteria bacterium]